ncbi:hypothetical protein PACTADRAFT_51712 [Pachysolen tannophilus NRRL Y-2460]|uniref:Transcription elongation factor Eaf N-terminal domain-containing protein n=1 Tax=Pachysolen tannophilus NRRL Y-2460 TaxID=669874 RepID=A0A1E4TQD1_PACTA|nr:hypothetical protein PACTADRAFT_51712 [Pachysolen tannophilus NRRL Y-2460]
MSIGPDLFVSDKEFDIDISALLASEDTNSGENFGIRFGFVPESIDEQLPFQLVKDTTTSERSFILKAETSAPHHDPLMFEGKLNNSSINPTSSVPNSNSLVDNVTTTASTTSTASTASTSTSTTNGSIISNNLNNNNNNNEYLLIYDEVAKNFRLEKFNGLIRMNRSRNVDKLLKHLEELDEINFEYQKAERHLQKMNLNFNINLRQETEKKNQVPAQLAGNNDTNGKWSTKQGNSKDIKDTKDIKSQDIAKKQKQNKTTVATLENNNTTMKPKTKQKPKPKTKPKPKPKPIVVHGNQNIIASKNDQDVDEIDLNKGGNGTQLQENNNGKNSITVSSIASKRLPVSKALTPALSGFPKDLKKDNYRNNSPLVVSKTEQEKNKNNDDENEDDDDDLGSLADELEEALEDETTPPPLLNADLTTKSAGKSVSSAVATGRNAATPNTSVNKDYHDSIEEDDGWAETNLDDWEVDKDESSNFSKSDTLIFQDIEPKKPLFKDTDFDSFETSESFAGPISMKDLVNKRVKYNSARSSSKAATPTPVSTPNTGSMNEISSTSNSNGNNNIQNTSNSKKQFDISSSSRTDLKDASSFPLYKDSNNEDDEEVSEEE